MRRIFLIGFLAVGIGLLGTRAWAADTSGSLTDAQVQLIRQNCKQAQSILQRLQSTDVATRINRGRIYENVLNRLITPFNNRVALNRYDASALTSATSTITQKFSDFKTDYLAYENSFSRLLGVDCEADPRGFYSLLTITREGRAKVADDVTQLNTLIGRYTDAFGALRRSIAG